MVTLYLHVGTPKTGTSFIQNLLWENASVIQKQGYIYPDFKMAFQGIGIARNGHFLVLNKDDIEDSYRKAIKKIKKIRKKYNNIIVSEESIWNTPTNIKRFIEDMKLMNIKVKILVYLRRQDLFLQSMWAQKVKEGSVSLEFNEYIKKHKNNIDYYKHCCFLRDLVGNDNMIVRVYENQQFGGEKNNLLTDFFEAVGLKYDDKLCVPSKLKNPSLSGIYLETKRMLNKYPEFNTRFNFIVRHLYKVAEERGEAENYSVNKYFTYEQQMEFLSKYSDTNEKVAKEFLKRDDGILFYDEIVEYEGNVTSFTTEEYVDILASIILNQHKKLKRFDKLIRKLNNKKIFRKFKTFLE